MKIFSDVIYQIFEKWPLIAPFVFIGIHTVMAALFIPCSPMTLIAGALWGQTYGLLISMVAAIVSSSTTFILSRSFLRHRIEKYFEKRFPKVVKILIQASVHDWKIIAVSQMNPMLPASTMGYVFGLSRISFTRYVVLSGLFILPLQILFVATGHSAINLIGTNKKIGLSIAVISLMILFIVLNKTIYKKICRIFGINNET